MRKLRVLVLMHDYLVPPADVTGIDVNTAPWRTEYDVVKTLRDDLEHDVHVLGVKDDLAGIRQANDEFKPHIAFNLMEAFHEVGTFDQNVVSYLELLRLSYTGCNPRGMLLARDKALSKKLLHYHRVLVPDFTVVPRGRKPKLSKKLTFPLIVKSLTQESSIGISQASVVDDEAKLVERVQFIHDSIDGDAIIEQFVEGRELYCGVIGNQRAAGAAGLGDDVREDARRPAPHRHRAREVEPEVPEEDGRRHRRREGPARGRQRSHPAHHAARVQDACSSAATPGSTCGSTRRGRSTSSRRIRTPKSPVPRTSRIRRRLPDSPTPRCCSAS